MKKQVVTKHVKSVLNNTLSKPQNVQPLSNVLSGRLINNIDLTLYGMTCSTKDDFIESVNETANNSQTTLLKRVDELVTNMSNEARNAIFQISELRTFPTSEIFDNELKTKVFDILSGCNHLTITQIVNLIKAVIDFEES